MNVTLLHAFIGNKHTSNRIFQTISIKFWLKNASLKTIEVFI